MGVKNKHLFQDSKHNGYFEGWYFKQVNSNNQTLALIPGISKSKKDKHAFIQIINTINYKTYYIRYPYESFSSTNNPFSITIGDNYFSLTKIIINIKDIITINGTLNIGKLTPINSSIFQPNIMGPFAYLPFMECNHCIISLKHSINGTMCINDKTVDFSNSVGYIEKDYGYSFPSDYIWLESNNSLNESSIFFSYALIPFRIFKFNGLITIIEYQGKQYRFATYNLSKVKVLKINNNNINIILLKHNFRLEINILLKSSHPLIAPLKGNMNKEVYESLDSLCEINLYQNEQLLLNDSYTNCGLELFGKFYKQ